MRETPSQTAGPYVHIGCTPRVTGINSVYNQDLGGSPISEGAIGKVIEITGVVTDGAGDPVTDGMIETWQADAHGLFPGESGADPKVTGWARIALDGDGAFALKTVKPGPTPDQAPHIALWITARGLNAGLQTRMYFGDEDNDADLLLPLIEESKRATLITQATSQTTHRFDICLQGDAETVFLDI